MRHLAALWLVLVACTACGPDQAQPEAVNTPESATELQKTEAERHHENLQQEQETEVKEFDQKEE